MSARAYVNLNHPQHISNVLPQIFANAAQCQPEEEGDDRIICGNSIEVVKTMPKASVDLVVTDPPYLINYKGRRGRKVINDNNPADVLPIFEHLYNVLKPNSYCISFYGWGRIAEFAKAWEAAGFRPVGHIVWPKGYISSASHLKCGHEAAYLLAKGNPKPVTYPIEDVQKWQYSGNKNHPTEKHVSIIKPLIEAYSKPGDTVLDPFLGSGTTAVAAALSGRDYIGVEMEQKYCDLAQKRLAGVQRYMH